MDNTFEPESVNPYQAPIAAAPATALSDAPKRSVWWALFSFTGRIPRRTYWAGSLVVPAVFLAFILAAISAFGEDSPAVNLLIVMFYVPLIWISLALGVKRWHDRDKSGWWVLIGMVPIIGPLWQFIEVGCMRGTEGANRFGPDPT